MLSTVSAIFMAWTVATAPAPERVYLGLDCNPGLDGNGDAVVYVVSLPDDVLTECE
ncbi:MAG: hypothetical protein OXI20_05445 [Rhodospirillales bacterium]|nr:hypothetical protein [Rhodospirillales bacterium]